MLNNINPTQTESWNKLKNHFDRAKEFQLKELFESDKDRFSKYTLKFENI